MANKNEAKNEVTLIGEHLQELTNLLRENINIYRSDRDMAVANYKSLKEQMDEIIGEKHLMSEDAALEKQLNTALGLVFKASERLDGVIKIVTQIIMTQVNTESRERIANTLKDSIPNKPVDFSHLLGQRDD